MVGSHWWTYHEEYSPVFKVYMLNYRDLSIPQEKNGLSEDSREIKHVISGLGFW